MNLLEALCQLVSNLPRGIIHARVAHFAFGDTDGEMAFLSEIEEHELVPLLEEWCRAQREKAAQKGVVH